MSLPPCQPMILEPVQPHASFLVFGLVPGHDPRAAILRLRDAAADWPSVIGFGAPLVGALAASIPELRAFPAIVGPGVAFPSTQGALWAYLPGTDRTAILDHALSLREVLGPGFRLDEEVLTFKYRTGFDLTGFEDGTENPKDEKAVAAAIVSGKGAGFDGGSFVAAQKFRHDLERFRALAPAAQDQVIGRERVSNEEMPDAPVSAHVKRTAQESYEPPAFMLRRSMPWGGAGEHGLYFVAFGESLDRFERVLSRMAGREDGIVDALLGFTRALSGGYYWCPPLKDGRLDLSSLGL
ncbi:Putative dye-decolorizing peroxidase (DyP), YfeX-like subgroup [Minicystis rosea]|nr:Putative dye-decolorizing peroxidase (DyP), YfeX-like subgroup [Minicystis rosea]